MYINGNGQQKVKRFPNLLSRSLAVWSHMPRLYGCVAASATERTSRACSPVVLRPSSRTRRLGQRKQGLLLRLVSVPVAFAGNCGALLSGRFARLGCREAFYLPDRKTFLPWWVAGAGAAKWNRVIRLRISLNKMRAKQPTSVCLLPEEPRASGFERETGLAGWLLVWRY